jgi:hypothetical protein
MRKLIIALAALALAASAAPSQARVRAGVLSCEVAPAVGFVIGSQRWLNCTFQSALGYRETYNGVMTRAGVDLGYISGGQLAWVVYAPARPGPGALAGGYAGASGEATLGGGLGANVMIGGIANSIALQPLSIGAQRGLNLAVGLSGLSLEYVP